MRDLETYSTLDGEVVDLSDLTVEEKAHFERAYKAWRRNSPWDRFGRLVTGSANPLVRDEKGRITPRVWSHPLFRALRDLEDRLGIQQGQLETEAAVDLESDPLDDEWISVSEAASDRKVSVQALHKAVDRGEIVAHRTSPPNRRLVSRRSVSRWKPSHIRQRAGLSRRKAVAGT